MTNRHIEDEGTPGEEIARITTRDVRWRKSGFTDGDKVCPAEERFETELALAALLANHVIVLNTHQWMKEWPEDAQKTTALSVSCNDIFAWACFDAEDIMIDELQSLYHLWIKDRAWGSAM